MCISACGFVDQERIDNSRLMIDAEGYFVEAIPSSDNLLGTRGRGRCPS